MKQTGSRLNSESFRELSILTFAAIEAPSYSPRHASGSESATARRGQSVLLVDPLIVSRYWATSF